MGKKIGLGRKLSDLGLNELLSDVSSQSSKDAPKNVDYNLPVEFLCPGKYQPRLDIKKESLHDLAASIRSQGIIQPILVRKISNGKYEIIAGERRWRAAQMVGLKTVPVIARDISDNEAIAYSLIENIQREDLNPIDTALALDRLIREFKITHEVAANAIGKSRTTITNFLRLLSLHEDVKKMLKIGDLEMGHARALLTLGPKHQVSVASVIVRNGLSVRAAESLVRRQKMPKLSNINEKKNPNILQLQQEISDKIGARVTVQHKQSGKGKLIINYHGLDELDGILKYFRREIL